MRVISLLSIITVCIILSYIDSDNKCKILNKIRTVFLIICSVVLLVGAFMTTRKMSSRHIPFYTYDIDDTFGLWSFSLVLPSLTLLNNKKQIVSHSTNQNVYYDYTVISFTLKLIYGVSFAFLFGSHFF
jgi:hypothetical protein